MKKFLLKVSIFAAYISILHIILPLFIDPFSVFHGYSIRENGVAPNKNYVKMKYILNNPGKYDSLLFGSSRVAAIHTNKMPGEKCYNMVYSGGLPGWHLLNIKTLFANNIRPKKIYIGIDSISYSGNYDSQVRSTEACPYEYLENDVIHFMTLYFNVSAVARSFLTMINFWRGKIPHVNYTMFYEYGFYDVKPGYFDWNDKRSLVPSYGKDMNIDLALQHLCEIRDICRENGTNLVLFTNPMHYKHI